MLVASAREKVRLIDVQSTKFAAIQQNSAVIDLRYRRRWTGTRAARVLTLYAEL